MNSKQIGTLTEYQCMTYLLSLGYSVSQPLGDKDRYDYIIDTGTKLLKVQSKTSRQLGDSIKFNCKSSNRRDGKTIIKHYTTQQIDYFSTFWNGKCYLIPVGECSSEKTLQLSKRQSNNQFLCSYIEDYDCQKVLSQINNPR